MEFFSQEENGGGNSEQGVPGGNTTHCKGKLLSVAQLGRATVIGRRNGCIARNRRPWPQIHFASRGEIRPGAVGASSTGPRL